MTKPRLHIQGHSNTVKDVKLNALLVMTKAINNNLSTSQLLDIYQDILENQLKVGKLVLFSFDTEWTCILKYGVDKAFNHLKFEPELLDIKEIETISFSNGELSKSFEIVIPVYHKSTPLAFVLLGDIDEKKLEVSAAIRHLPFIQTLTNVMVVAIENKKLSKQSIQRAAIQKELELAQGMQRLLFPTKLPNTEEVEMSALYLPHQQVGGDYYDVIWLNEFEFIFCLADVSGKGVAAALLMSNLQAALHLLLRYTQNLSEIVIDINQLIFDNAKGEKFISLFIAKYNIATRKLSYINAGHNAPILFNNDKFLTLSKGCTLLGIINPLNALDSETILLSKQSFLLAYTDGLTDTTNSKGESLALEEIEAILLKNRNGTCEFINNALLYYLEEFKAEMPFADDIALLSCKFR
ncbi:MAG: SpoIIE family protein phosphatase [Bacteroidetes bacterium]|nr:SpoIIE family protein phosphatase [Bacteroidota bacterium]